MMSIEDFKAADLAAIDVQDAQASIRPHVDWAGASYEGAGPAFTLRKDGRVVACVGAIWTSRGAHLWAVLSRNPPLLALHRMALRAFAAYPNVRVTASCHTDFGAGCRWLEMLGFRREATVEDVWPEHRPHHIYVREAH